MKKLTDTMRGLGCILAMAIVILNSMPAFAQSASGAPALTSFYPAKNDEAPYDLRPGVKAYAYFETGSKVVSTKAHLVQNGQDLGTVEYLGSAGGSNYTTMDPSKPANAAMASLQSGLFTLEFFEVTYMSNGEEVTYTAQNGLLGSVSYNRPAANGKIINETGFDGRLIKSYYPANGTEGVKVYTFDKAVLPDGINGYYQYGVGEQMVTVPVPVELSADGLTLTVDVRGKCYNVDTMAPGVTFTDIFGTPLDNPENITLVIEHLYCADGTQIEMTAVSLDEQFSTTVTGRIYQNYHYQDITFPTPILVKAEFYDKNTPANRFMSINDATDMMDLTLTNAQYIVSTDIKLNAGGVEAVVADANIVKSGDVYTVTLPANIKAAGSAHLVISLVNTVFTEDDGAAHTVRPLDLSGGALEVNELGSLKGLAEGTDVVLNTIDGVKVTMSNEYGYIFIEDATGAAQVLMADYAQQLKESTLVTGRLKGTYLGYGMLQIDMAKSDITEHMTDVSVGEIVTDLDAIVNGDYDCRLVTIPASSDITMVYDSDINAVMVADLLPALCDFIEGFEAPEAIANVTGVICKDPSIGQAVMLLRSNRDINQNISTTPDVNTVAELRALEPGTMVTLHVNGAKTTYSNDDYAMSVIEDETGAVMVYTDDDSLLSKQGDALVGVIYGQYADGMFIVYTDQTNVDTFEVDVVTGVTIDPSEVTAPENTYRLVTFDRDNNITITSTDNGLMIGDEVAGVDYFGVLDYDYEFPKNVKSFTGIIVPNIVSMDGEQSQVGLVAFRSSKDIVSVPTGIESLLSDGKAQGDVYDLRGVRVRAAGESLKGLKGFYIIDGNKYLIK